MSMEELQDIPDSVLKDMLEAQADVIEPAQKRKGRDYGVHRTGVTLGSIKRDKPRRTKDGGVISISLQGRNARGNTNAEVAFINEFGKRGQPPRPFIRDATEENADKASDAAANVYGDWLDSKKL